jgi:hypothetical protein
MAIIFSELLVDFMLGVRHLLHSYMQSSDELKLVLLKSNRNVFDDTFEKSDNLPVEFAL